jgi:hypothetical protein
MVCRLFPHALRLPRPEMISPISVPRDEFLCMSQCHRPFIMCQNVSLMFKRTFVLEKGALYLR